jgi:uncharacterized membrane protein YuzA (DUF378 family)
VATLFGAGSVLSRAVYILVGASALWQLIPLLEAFKGGEASALRGH